ncbi:MAG: ABC transporter substrate-binding protein [Acidimicrobiia bacterium]|nr:ABC transporter substrate-binding protein [Acidimicrobiia bacterium]
MARMMRLVALLMALGLVAAACGGSDDDTSAEGETEAETETEADAGGSVDDDAAREALAESTTTSLEGGEEGATTIEDLETQWAAARAAVVQRIKDEGYGVDDNNILTGPAGFEVDLNQCPSNWTETEGIVDGRIKIGHTTALSGNLAAYGNIAAGMETYFDYVNANGGINGLEIELIVKDDGYVATNTIELVDELLQSDKPFMINTLGSPNTLAVYDNLNAQCIPHPFVQTGHPAWGDPENHPWTTAAAGMSYATEAVLWGNWIKTNLADELPVRVSGLVMDNDFGLAYRDGFQKWADANPDVVSEFVPVPHDPAAATVTNEMTTIAASEPDVFISMTAGNPCLLAVQEAGNSGLTDGSTVLFAPSVCKDPNAYMIPAGEAADGWYIIGGGVKATTDPQYADDAYIQFLNERLDAAGLDASVGLYGSGFGQHAWPHVEALRIAAELDGGLTRSNLLIALRSMEGIHPAFLDGIVFSVNGNEDAYYIEGSDISIYDAAGESWIQQGPAVDLNGSSPNCAWGDDGC